MNYLATITDSMLKSSSNVELLDAFIANNMNDVYELDNHCHEESKEIKQEVDKYIKGYHSIIEQLDYTKDNNVVFILILIGYCERFGLISSFQYLFRILEDNDISLPSRIEAAQIYLYGISSNEQYISSLENICQLIQHAIDEENEDLQIAVCSFLNYLHYVIRNIPHYRERLTQSVIELRDKNIYNFLHENIIDEIINLTDDKPSSIMAEKIDYYIHKCSYRAKGYNNFVIEQNTDYANSIKAIAKINFQNIRQISLNNSVGTDTPKSRGCNPITEENDLFLYIRSYGNMHYAKISEALEVLPLEVLTNNSIEIISWGCGQGIEIIALMERINIGNIHKVTLIEPSDIALKRASLHVNSLGVNTSKINTICKYINDITSADIQCTEATVKIHLFSNILDIPSVSLTYLKQLITAISKGVNYFICVSPYERPEKAQRLEQFKQNFTGYRQFILLKDAISTKDPNTYWMCNQYFKYNYFCHNHPHNCNGRFQWTRTIKVFSNYI